MKKLLLILTSLLMLSSCVATAPVKKNLEEITSFDKANRLVDLCVERYVDKNIDIAKAIEVCERIYRPERR